MGRRKKETVEDSIKEVGFRVNVDHYTDITDECGQDEEWCRDSTTSSWTVNGLEIEEKYPDVTACFPVASGDQCYLVYAVHSTGDSFGHDENSQITYVDLFSTSEKAHAAAKVIQDHASWYRQVNNQYSRKNVTELENKYEQTYGVNITRENGNILLVDTGWNGYFESLSYVEVINLVIDGRRRYTL